MSAGDGHNIISTSTGTKLVSCSRWAELITSLKFHTSLAITAGTPAEFRFLNQGIPTVVGALINGHEDVSKRQYLEQLLNGSPSGGTPLCTHINEVVRQIRASERELRAAGKKALVVIATDGEASDGDVAAAMRPLKNLPVWVIVRLCTDQNNIVSYWNHIDKDLELDMDVLDDLCGEAKEIGTWNPWLTYGEPLQRLREFGCSTKELDLLDERKLSLEEVRKVCSYIYGGSVDSFPHPEVDWIHFCNCITHHNDTIPKVWCPRSQQLGPWVDVNVLKYSYHSYEVVAPVRDFVGAVE
eukprot:gene28940-35895_t